MTGNQGKINFTHGLIDASAEIKAYGELLGYLIKSGKYSDAVEIDNDANERVRFCEEMDLYAEDAQLKNASIHQKKILALIYSNKLQDVIAENGGYLPDLNSDETLQPSITADANEIIPGADPDPEINHNEVIINLDRSEQVNSNAEPAIESAITSKGNSFLQITWYVIKALIIVAVLLASFTFLFSSEDLLRIAKYNFLLFIVLLVVFVAISEGGGKLMRHLHYAVSYLFFLTSATLSGLLFLQQPWSASAFNLHGGVVAASVNFIIHAVIAIGPFWLGVFFGVASFVLLIVTWAAGSKIRNGLL